MKKRIISISIFVVGFCAGAAALPVVASWNAPAAGCVPPDCNVEAPLNIGGLEQIKTGLLGLTDLVVKNLRILTAAGTTTATAGKVLTAIDNEGTVGWVDAGGLNAVLLDAPIVLANKYSNAIDKISTGGASELLFWAVSATGRIQFRWPGQTTWKDMVVRIGGEDQIERNSIWLPLDSNGEIEIRYDGVYGNSDYMAFVVQGYKSNQTFTLSTTAISGYPDTTAPEAPPSLTASKSADSKTAILSWQNSSDPTPNSTGIASYKIYRESNIAATVAATTLTYTDTLFGLLSQVNGNKMTYQVIAVDKANNQSVASVITVTYP